MNEEQIREIAQEVYDQNQDKGRLSNFKVPFHVHNGSDSPRISQDNVVPGTYATAGITSSTSEIFTIETFPSTDTITLHGIAYDSSASPSTKKAHLNGSASIGNVFAYGNSNGASVSLIQMQNGTYVDIAMSSSSIYIDTSDLTKTRVNAAGTDFSGGASYLIYVTNDVGTVVASMIILDWSETSITFQTTLATNWKTTFFLTMS